MTDVSFQEYVLEQLAGVGKLSTRSMFGGHGLYLNGVFFAIVHKSSLYFRTDAASRTEYLRRGSRPFNPKGKQQLHCYYEVPAGILDDAESLHAWARAAAKADG